MPLKNSKFQLKTLATISPYVVKSPNHLRWERLPRPVKMTEILEVKVKFLLNYLNIYCSFLISIETFLY